MLLIRFVLFFALAYPAFAETLSGRIVGVSDGDTVTLLDKQRQQHKVRLAGIDAPEKAQAFGHRSKEHLSQLLFDRVVQIEGNKTDRYGRLVGKIWVGGKDANLEQIRAGMAWHYKQYKNEQSPTDRAFYADTEEQARRQRKGLWSDHAAQPPWDFRHRGEAEKTSSIAVVTECPCGGRVVCSGPKGGRYCMMPNGRKQYR